MDQIRSPPEALPQRPVNPYRFTGRRLDFKIGDGPREELVLYHYRARAYDAFRGQ